MRREVRSEFQVLILDPDENRRNEVLAWVLELGFSAQAVSSKGSFESYLEAQVPHMVLIADHLELRLPPLCQKAREASAETQILVYASRLTDFDGSMLQLLQSLKTLRIAEFIEIPPLGLRDHLRRWPLEAALDRSARQLFLVYESETWKARAQKFEHDLGEAVSYEKSLQLLRTQLRELSVIGHPDRLIDRTLELTSEVLSSGLTLYLRWIPVREAFVFANAYCRFMDVSQLQKARGLGVKMMSDESHISLSQKETWEEKIARSELARFCSDVFSMSSVAFVPHLVGNEMIGLFVYEASELSKEQKADLEAVGRVFELAWSRLSAIRDRHLAVWERVDRETALPNASAFNEQMLREVSRARRLIHPLSLACIVVENLDPVRKKNFKLDAVQRKVYAKAIARELHGPDYLAVGSEFEFLILMPHTSLKTSVSRLNRVVAVLNQIDSVQQDTEKGRNLNFKTAVVSFPEAAQDADQLLERVKAALNPQPASKEFSQISHLLPQIEEISPQIYTFRPPHGYMPEYKVLPGFEDHDL